MSADRAADARAEEAKNIKAHAFVYGPWDETRCRVCGWRLRERMEDGCVPGNCSMRPPPAKRADAPVDFNSPAAARLLLEALKPEQRRRFVRALMNKVIPVAWAHEGPIFRFDFEEAFALLLAPPAAIRDAVLEAVEQ